jgi:hypothetical protein
VDLGASENPAGEELPAGETAEAAAPAKKPRKPRGKQAEATA